MELSQKILSDITVFSKYSRYDHDKKRRETWDEIIDRNKDMHIAKYPMLEDEINEVYERSVYPKKVLPSMRSLQFAGRAIERNPSRIYNCCYLPIDDTHAFSELMFLLLGGTGVGYSVQYQHVGKLPLVVGPKNRTKRFIIGDNIEGWADSVKILVEAYFYGKSKPAFDYEDIREKGTELVVSGGKAPGPAPLRRCLELIEAKLKEIVGRNIEPIEAHDIACYIADAVLAGGIRRSAMISLFSPNDEAMISCKSGEWWNDNPQRGRANNSVTLLRSATTREQFDELWQKVKDSGSGEPGFYWTNNLDLGTNPCAEISLLPFSFCNLTEIAASTITDQNDFNQRAYDAAFLGTLQAGYIDFHYLRPIWQETTEKDALIGVGMTGIASGNIDNLDEAEAARIVVETNRKIANIIGINPAARTTTVKPSGTTSLVVGSSSGIHGWHAPYYLRRMRLGKDETIYQYLNKTIPELIEDEYFRPNEQAVISIPQKAPDNAKFRSESALELLERVKRYNINWVKTGHISGDNTNNVSVTVSIKDNEWNEVGEWMWSNRDTYNGISVLPYDGGTYKQTPFEDISENQYYHHLEYLKDIDLTKVYETEDNTDLTGEAACMNGSCEIDYDALSKE